MKIISVDKNNIDDEHICCAIGNDKINFSRAQTKKVWMKNCFKEGLVFKKYDARGKVFIEYTDIENVWKPVIGKNYLMINCFWVSGKFQGHGYAKKLLDECIKDAKKQKKDGIAVVTSAKKTPFLTEKKFYKHNGFETVDKAPPYFELMVLNMNSNSEIPEFTPNAKKGVCSNKSGFTFMFSNQCPFAEEYVDVMIETAKEKKFKTKKIKIDNKQDAQKLTSPFGTFSVFYNGKIITHEIMSEKRFNKLLDEILKGKYND